MKRINLALVAKQLEHSPRHAWGLVLLLCVLFVLPALFIRAAHYEEGTTVALARSLFEDGHWLANYRYGQRFVERPQLLSWLLGLVGLLTGTMPLWLARMPTVLSLVGGAALIHWFVRRYASPLAALFAVVCFVASPMLLQKTITAEPDVAVGAVLFGAFVVFWRGYETGGPSHHRWLGIIAILAVAVLIKGPQPLAFFFLGVGAFLMLRRQWRSVLLLAACGLTTALVAAAWYAAVYQPGDLAIWAAHSRLASTSGPPPKLGWSEPMWFASQLVIQTVPGILLFIPWAWLTIRQGAPRHHPLSVALLCYAAICTLVLLFWPGANARYGLPAIFAIATGAGVAFDSFVGKWVLVRGTVIVAAALVIYRLVLNWIVMPVKPELFRQQAIAAERVTALVRSPAPILVTDRIPPLNLLAHVPHAAHIADRQTVLRAPAPFWAIVGSDELADLQAGRPPGAVTLHLAAPDGAPWQLLEVRDR